MALFRTLPAPTNDLLPSLMVEVCLVLAPDATSSLIHANRPRGLPCWPSLSFFLSAIRLAAKLPSFGRYSLETLPYLTFLPFKC